MPQQAEVWFFEHSLAAPLARPLSRRYALRALSRPSRGSRLSVPNPGNAPVVCLADLGAGDLVPLQRLARRVRRLRLIGISRNGTTQNIGNCFATIPRKANPALVRKTVDAAVANIELAQRE